MHRVYLARGRERLQYSRRRDILKSWRQIAAQKAACRKYMLMVMETAAAFADKSLLTTAFREWVSIHRVRLAHIGRKIIDPCIVP